MDETHRMSGGARVTAVVVLCLLTPLVAVVGLNVYAGLIPLGCAAWLAATLPWSGPARFGAVIAVLVAGVGLTIALLSWLFSMGSFE